MQNFNNSSQPTIQVADEAYANNDVERPFAASQALHRATQALKRLQVALFRYIGTSKFNLLSQPSKHEFVEEEFFDQNSTLINHCLRKSRASIDLKLINQQSSM